MSTKAQRLLLKVPYHSERLYALVRNHEGQTEMCYLLSPSVKELYETVIDSEMLGSGHTKESLRAAGWVARPVHVEEYGNEA